MTNISLVLIIHYVIGVLSILFNSVLIIIVARKTPRQYRTNAHLVFQEAVFLIVSSIANFVSMQRLIPIPDTTIFGSLGVCSLVSSCFCYYFHVLTVGAFACSFFIASYQLIFRHRLLNDVPIDHVLVYSDCNWGNWNPRELSEHYQQSGILQRQIVIFITQINAALHQSDSAVLERFVNATFPVFIEEKIAINGHDSFSIPVLIVNGFYIISLPTMWISVFFFRRSVLFLLNSRTSKLSEKSKHLQTKLVKLVTVHAALSSAALWPTAVFFLGQFVAVHNTDFLDSCFFFIQLHCVIAPVMIVYYVPNYRKTLLALAGISLASKDDASTAVEVLRNANFVHNVLVHRIR